MPVGFSDYQHQRDMAQSFPGEWKQFIFNGIGISRYLKATGSKLLALKNNTRQQLQKDGYNPGDIKTTWDDNGTLIIKLNTQL